jgi:hypothetical protein
MEKSLLVRMKLFVSFSNYWTHEALKFLMNDIEVFVESIAIALLFIGFHLLQC